MVPGLDPETLERLRRGVPLRLTAMGEFKWDDGPISHRGVRSALRAGLDLSDSGEPIVRIGRNWCYLTVDDCVFRATAATPSGELLRIRLDDDREVDIDPGQLWEEPGRGLRTLAPSAARARPLSVRFTNRAQMDLAPFLEIDESGTFLKLGARKVSLAAPTQTHDSR